MFSILMEKRTESLRRILVIGTSGCGKTTFAASLGSILRIKSTQLDELYWNAGWQPVENSVFLKRLDNVLSRETWILDGNFRRIQPRILKRATTVIWLDYSFARIMYRIIKRTFIRSVTGEKLYNDNFETLQKGFFSRDSIILWAVKTFGVHRREYTKLMAGRRSAREECFRFSSPREADKFLSTIRDDTLSVKSAG